MDKHEHPTSNLMERIKALAGPQQQEIERIVASFESLNKLDAGDGSVPGTCWPHAPSHRLSVNGTFIVTAGTLHKAHIFRGHSELDMLQNRLLQLSKEHQWHLEAWACFSNHYHFVGHNQTNEDSLGRFLTQLHAETAREINQWHGCIGRKVWHNFFETRLSFEKSYLARLNYVHQNAVKHRLVTVASQYRWCSAAWFERTATPVQVKTIYGFKTDKLKVLDDFEV